MNKAHRLVAQW